MKILVYKDLILTYIRQNYTSEEQKSLVEKILYNENSIFLYSKKFIELLEKEIDMSESSRELVRYHSFINKILHQHQDKRPNVKTGDSATNFDEEFSRIYSTTQDKVVVTISCNQPSQKLQTIIPNIVVLSQQQKPNYHWLVANLAILHPNSILVRNHDFLDDNEIDKFFFDIFSIPRSISIVSIFDDACNFQHSKFRFLSEKKVKVLYYTVKLNIPDIQTKFNDLKRKLPSVKLFGKPKGGHEREINFDGIITIPTNDFWMLNIKDGRKWSISVLFDENGAKKSLDYTSNYKRFLDNQWV